MCNVTIVRGTFTHFSWRRVASDVQLARLGTQRARHADVSKSALQTCRIEQLHSNARFTAIVLTCSRCAAATVATMRTIDLTVTATTDPIKRTAQPQVRYYHTIPLLVLVDEIGPDPVGKVVLKIEPSNSPASNVAAVGLDRAGLLCEQCWLKVVVEVLADVPTVVITPIHRDPHRDAFSLCSSVSV